MRNGEAARAVCKQTCLYGGYSGLKHGVSLLKVQFVWMQLTRTLFALIYMRSILRVRKTFVVLQVNSFMNVFIGIVLSFYQHKNDK